MIKLKNSARTQEILAIASNSFGSQRMQIINTSPSQSFPQDSRYVGHSIITVRVGPEREMRIIETWERPYVPPITQGSSDKFFYVDAAYSYRSDLISNSVFGTPRYSWWILVSNNLSDDSQLPPATTLRILPPPVETIAAVARRPF